VATIRPEPWGPFATSRVVICAIRGRVCGRLDTFGACDWSGQAGVRTRHVAWIDSFVAAVHPAKVF